MGRLKGCTALITGASRGIGRAIARAYAEEGASLFLTAMDEQKLAEVAAELIPISPLVSTYAADLGDEEQLRQMFAAAVNWAPDLDVVVNNAGIYIGKPVEQYTRDDFDRMMRINVYAVFALMQLSVKHMRHLGRGKIVNISSTAGKWESPNQSLYNTSKHAVVGMAKCIALETAAQGINVNSICPGMVDTDMFKEFETHAQSAGLTLAEFKDVVVARIPQGKFLEPMDVARVAVFLASSESDGMTGQTVTISGGMRMG